MLVKVPSSFRLNEDRYLTLIEEGCGYEVFDEKGRPLGRVFKSTYTYSPPLHRGSPIARYHRKVQCWKNDKANLRQHWPTRREALTDLLARDSEALEGKA